MYTHTNSSSLAGFSTSTMNDHTVNSIISLLKSRAAPAISLGILGAVLTTLYMLPEENLKMWMLFVEFAIAFTASSLITETSTFLMPHAVRFKFRVDGFTDVFTFSGVVTGALAIIVRGIENAPDTATGLMEMVGVTILGLVLMGAAFLILFAKPSWRKAW